jgi:histidine triad (HIT) family protein
MARSSFLIDVFRRLARSRLGAGLIRWIIVNMSFALPVDRLYESPRWMAFYHPQPTYPLHILLLPRKAIGSIEDTAILDSDLLVELFQIVQKLAAQLNLQETGYRLIVNSGTYQDFPQVHFHLVSGEKRSS